MTRTAGARGADYDDKRAALLGAIRARLAQPDGQPPSLREMAAAAGVTIPTLRHYFGKRDDVVAALLEQIGRDGAPYLAETATTELPFADSVAALLAHSVAGLRAGLSEVHMLGLREGLRHERLGPAYLATILEPSLQAIETRLSLHQARREMRSASPRHAALALLSPLVLAGLHQHELGGATLRTLDIDAFVADHAAAFVRAYAG